MARWLKFMLIVGPLLVTLGCNRQPKGVASQITIQVPQAQDTMQKTGGVGSMSAMPSNRKACYGVIVSGEGIVGEGSGCSPTNGVFAGFVEPGGLVTVSVPQGSKRKVELFAHLQDENQNNPCPKFLSRMAPAELAKVYLVGSANGIDMLSDQVTVEIVASFPGLTNTVAQTRGLPATCTAAGGSTGPQKPPGLYISSGASVAIQSGFTEATGMKIVGRVSLGKKK